MSFTIRSSSLARTMACAGYIFLDLPEDQGNEAASEGTAAGEYLQHLLEGTNPMPVMASNGIYFNDEMKFYLTPIFNDILSRTATQVLCETRIDWSTSSGVMIRGQYDASFVDKNGRLCIEDLKYGWGIVNVKENWQLLAYAIGEVIRRGQVFNEISFKIHQPRPHHEDGSTREWIISYQELLGYKQQIDDRMTSIANGMRDLSTSSNCKYCRGAQEACPAFNRLFNQSLEVTTTFIQDSLTDQEIAIMLDQIKRAEEVIKIKHDSLVELGVSRIKAGKIIPGYIQTEKYGHRVWKQGITSETVQALAGINIIEQTTMSPAKAEKAGLSKAFVKQLTHAPLVGMKLEKKNASDVGNKIFGTTNPIGG